MSLSVNLEMKKREGGARWKHLRLSITPKCQWAI